MTRLSPSDPHNLRDFLRAYLAYLAEHLDLMVDPLNSNDDDEANGSVKTLSNSQDSIEELEYTR
jgi:hypothetical protein